MTTEQVKMNVNEAPWPTELEDLIDNLEYKPGWIFNLRYMDRGQGSKGLTFCILTLTTDSYGEYDGTQESLIPTYRVNHYFIVPSASYNRTAWQRWLLDRLIEVETHEACEFFRIEGDRIFAPHHSEGEDPYSIFMISDRETASLSFRDKTPLPDPVVPSQ